MSTNKKKKWNLEEEIEKELTTTGLDRKFEKVNASDQGTTYIRDFDQPITPKPINRPSVREDISWNKTVDFVADGVISAKPQGQFTGQVTKEGIRAISHPREEIDANFDRVTDEELSREQEEKELRAGFEDTRNIPRRPAPDHVNGSGGFHECDVIARIDHAKEDQDDKLQKYRPLDSLSAVSPDNFGTKIVRVRKE